MNGVRTDRRGLAPRLSRLVGSREGERARVRGSMAGKRASEVPLMAGLGPSYAPRAPKTSRVSPQESTKKVDALQRMMMNARKSKSAAQTLQPKEE